MYDPGDPMSKMFFNMLAVFAEFEVDLLRMRTREGMAIARAKGRLRGRQPKLSARQRALLIDLQAKGEHTIAELAEMFSVSRPTVYRVLGGGTGGAAGTRPARRLPAALRRRRARRDRPAHGAGRAAGPGARG